MSVLFCRIPDFLLATTLRRQPALAGLPLGLMGEDERLWAVSPVAQEGGVHTGMTARQARMRCPDLRLHALDGREGMAEQEAFVAELARWELPVEAHGWGAAWLDLHTVATQSRDVQPLAVELGRRLRTTFGPDRQPALGWDSSKFTSRAAAHCATAGAVRLVGKTDETRFLAPLSVSLLPLPEPALQQLHWLGIRTLGQYSALPSTAIWQRWGQVGKLAQRWAQGKDNRPVAGSTRTLPAALDIEIDPPSDQLGLVLADLMAALHAPLRALAAQLAGVRRLRLTLHFLPAAVRTLDLTFVEPAAQPARVQAALAQQLQALVWPGEVERLELRVLEVGEPVAGQLALFADLPAALLADDTGADTGADAGAAQVAEMAQRWRGRYGRCFFVGQVLDAAHPVHERVHQLQSV